MVREIVESKYNKVQYYYVSCEYIYRDAPASCRSRDANYITSHGDRRKILEVSTASNTILGEQLSAMNLKYFNKPLESVYQSTKVFLEHPNNRDWENLEPFEAKKRAKINDMLLGFKYEQISCTLDNGYLMYNWLYTNSVMQSGLLDDILEYDLFADIFFNPDKSFNCQARALAATVTLAKNGKLGWALKDFNNFAVCTQDLF